MPARLIITADDLGLHASIDRGIARACRAGRITAASLMCGGPTAAGAVAGLAELPGLDIGLHLSLTGAAACFGRTQGRQRVDGSSVMAADWPQLLARWRQSGFRAAVTDELRAQRDWALSHGIRPSHLDGHQHLHVLPGVLEVVIGLARELRPVVVRVPCEPPAIWSTGRCRVPTGRLAVWAGLWVLSVRARRHLARAGVVTVDRCWGIRAAGLHDAATLCAMIRRIRSGVHEWVMHPAEPEPGADLGGLGVELRARELTALLDPQVGVALRRQGVQLIGPASFARESARG